MNGLRTRYILRLSPTQSSTQLGKGLSQVTYVGPRVLKEPRLRTFQHVATSRLPVHRLDTTRSSPRTVPTVFTRRIVVKPDQTSEGQKENGSESQEDATKPPRSGLVDAMLTPIIGMADCMPYIPCH